jgi:hypothetical protein
MNNISFIFINMSLSLALIYGAIASENSTMMPSTPAQDIAAPNLGDNTQTSGEPGNKKLAKQGDDFQTVLNQSFRASRIKSLKEKTNPMLTDIETAPDLPQVNFFNNSKSFLTNMKKVGANPYVALSKLAFMDQDKSKQWVQIGHGKYILPRGTQVWTNAVTPPEVIQHPNDKNLWVVNTEPSGPYLRSPGPILLRLPKTYKVLQLKEDDHEGTGQPCMATTEINDFSIYSKKGICMSIPSQKFLKDFDLID